MIEINLLILLRLLLLFLLLLLLLLLFLEASRRYREVKRCRSLTDFTIFVRLEQL